MTPNNPSSLHSFFGRTIIHKRTDIDGDNYPIAIVTVGLPGRGKTFTARSLSRYLQWQGIQSKCFSVAEYRRSKFGEKLDPSYYDPNNQDLFKLRLELAYLVLNDLINWLLNEKGQVGIFDAANITLDRRQMVQEKLSIHGIQVIFLEVICNNSENLLTNLKSGAKYSPEYYGMDLDTALMDMKARLSFYEPYYEPVGDNSSESSQSFIKVINVCEYIVTNRIFGYLPTKMAHYLMNMNPITKHIIFLYESTNLSHTNMIRNMMSCYRQMQIWSGPSPNAINLAEDLHQMLSKSNLFIKSQLSRIELSAFEKKNLEQIKLEYPNEYEKFIQDPYYHRFPGGESYNDLAIRLENVLMELEGARSNAVLLISDTSVLRCLYAYYTNIPSKDIPFIDIPTQMLIDLEPCAYGSIENRYELDHSSESIPKHVLIDCFRYTAS